MAGSAEATVRDEFPNVTARHSEPGTDAFSAGIRVAEASSNNPFAFLFSLFTKKPEPKPAVIQQRQPGLLTDPKGRRLVAPYIGGGARNPDGSILSRPRVGGTRTMCVRLCDGYYWPVNSGRAGSRITQDSQRCESSCSSSSRLYILGSQSDNIAGMRDMNGKRYGSLKTAFRYRKSYDAACRCRSEPWSERAQLRHKRYSAVGRERYELAVREVVISLRPSVVTLAMAPLRGDTGLGPTPHLPVRNPRTSQRFIAAASIISGVFSLRPSVRQVPAILGAGGLGLRNRVD